MLKASAESLTDAVSTQGGPLASAFNLINQHFYKVKFIGYSDTQRNWSGI